MNGQSWRWWLLIGLTSPVVIPLALYTRLTALRLAPAAGPAEGVAGVRYAGRPVRLLLLGESTAAGVGVSCLSQALVGQLASALADSQQRPVAWRVLAENGITATQACQRLLPQVPAGSFDLAVLVFGVNDCSHLTRLSRWRASLCRLAVGLQAGGASVVFTGVPPLQYFTALPWLLRWLLGARAQQLDAQLQALADEHRALYVPLELDFSDEYLALDGYHPSGAGYRVWAQHLAAAITRSLHSRKID
ncbi:SGNH/GDSL hydrolase family protein [Pseudomonas sp. M30-35]|uniref:SGNH/GDSL hydrolase family protein n=1 Tax=Pseudomonas sp. M30-35 TaxID=1981174 RepID=UPI000B3D0C42|nr:SGNH/GDSL hydrolase family protein [Pseudomonas sp. M30-35]ARU87691.1 lysophospholipase [Pseudomonas sp. M30-35]